MRTEQEIRRAKEILEIEQKAAQVLFEKLDRQAKELIQESWNLPFNVLWNHKADLKIAEEHTSKLQSRQSISYAVSCSKTNTIVDTQR